MTTIDTTPRKGKPGSILKNYQDLLAERKALTAALAQSRAETQAALSGCVKIKPLVFDWAKDTSDQNPSCWRCQGEGYFAYVLIPYDPGNDPLAGSGKWNANPNHCGKTDFETREAAMAYCEETIRRQAAAEVKNAIATLALWAEAAIQPDTSKLAKPVADTVRGVWGICEALEDEAHTKLKGTGLTDYEQGFWFGRKFTAKTIRRATEMPAAIQPDTSKLALVREALVGLVDACDGEIEEVFCGELNGALKSARAALTLITAQEEPRHD